MSPNKGKKKTARRKRGSVDCKTVLMDAVVHLTAESGIENLSTRIIADTAPGVSGDVYIYNIFGSKENLLLETFLREDAKYAEVFEKSSSVLWETGMALESRLRNLWHGVWSWLTVANPETCLFLTRYSCSCFFDKAAMEKHRDVWKPPSEKLRELFPAADTARMMETAALFLLTTAFGAVRNPVPYSGIASENGYRMLEGLFGYWLGNESKPSKAIN